MNHKELLAQLKARFEGCHSIELTRWEIAEACSLLRHTEGSAPSKSELNLLARLRHRVARGLRRHLWLAELAVLSMAASRANFGRAGQLSKQAPVMSWFRRARAAIAQFIMPDGFVLGMMPV